MADVGRAALIDALGVDDGLICGCADCQGERLDAVLPLIADAIEEAAGGEAADPYDLWAAALVRGLARDGSEEAGEFNDAEHDRRPVDLALLRQELIQPAAMAPAWAGSEVHFTVMGSLCRRCNEPWPCPTARALSEEGTDA